MTDALITSTFERSPRREAPQLFKILIIDDDIELSEMIQMGLKSRLSCHVDIAFDPFEAMNSMTDRFYDLIILDWRLPALTGGQTLKELEKGFYFEPGLPIEWDHHRVPVIVFSSSEKKQCHLNKTKHFVKLGFVSKYQHFDEIISSFETLIQFAMQTNPRLHLIK